MEMLKRNVSMIPSCLIVRVTTLFIIFFWYWSLSFTGFPPLMWKRDVAKAYRRLAIPMEYHVQDFVFHWNGSVWCFVLADMMFGDASAANARCHTFGRCALVARDL